MSAKATINTHPFSMAASLLLLCFMVSVSLAETSDAEFSEVERSWDFGIGMGYGELNNPFVASDEVPLYVILDFAWYGDRFFFDNGDFGYTLIEKENMGLNLIANYSSERIYYSYFNQLGVRINASSSIAPVVPVDGGQSPLERLDQTGLNGISPNSDLLPFELPDTDFAINAGIEWLFSGDFGQLQTQLTHDVSSTHNGAELWVEYSYAWHWDRWGLRPNIGINWKDSDLVDYYYGIDQSVNPEIILFYAGQETFNWSLGMTVNYEINNHWSIIGQLGYEFFGDEIKNSPLIEDDKSQSVFAGLFYRF